MFSFFTQCILCRCFYETGEWCFDQRSVCHPTPTFGCSIHASARSGRVCDLWRVRMFTQGLTISSFVNQISCVMFESLRAVCGVWCVVCRMTLNTTQLSFGAYSTGPSTIALHLQNGSSIIMKQLNLYCASCFGGWGATTDVVISADDVTSNSAAAYVSNMADPAHSDIPWRFASGMEWATVTFKDICLYRPYLLSLPVNITEHAPISATCTYPAYDGCSKFCSSRFVCSNVFNPQSHACGPACAPGYTGVSCQTDINECASNPCLPPTPACVDQLNGYSVRHALNAVCAYVALLLH